MACTREAKSNTKFKHEKWLVSLHDVALIVCVLGKLRHGLRTFLMFSLSEINCSSFS